MERACLVCRPRKEPLEWESHQILPQPSPQRKYYLSLFCWTVGQGINVGGWGNLPFGCGEQSREEPRRETQEKQLVLPHCPNLTSESEAGAPSTGLPGAVVAVLSCCMVWRAQSQ